jgi:hypothetical protein
MSSDNTHELIESYDRMCADWHRRWNNILRLFVTFQVVAPLGLVVAAFAHNIVATVVFATALATLVVAIAIMSATTYRVRLHIEKAFDVIEKETTAPCATAQCNREVYFNAATEKYLHVGAGTECSTAQVATPAMV